MPTPLSPATTKASRTRMTLTPWRRPARRTPRRTRCGAPGPAASAGGVGGGRGRSAPGSEVGGSGVFMASSCARRRGRPPQGSPWSDPDVRRRGRPCDHRPVASPCPLASPGPGAGGWWPAWPSAVARGLRLDVNIVRLALLLLALAGGFGVAVYGVLWLVLPVTDAPAPEVRTHRVDDAAALVAVVGALLVLRAWGVWFSDEVTIDRRRRRRRRRAGVGSGRKRRCPAARPSGHAAHRRRGGAGARRVRRLHRPHRRRGRRSAAAPSAR